MHQNPMHNRQRRPSRFRGDRFLRLTPEEVQLIAHAEAIHGFGPDRQQDGLNRGATPAPPALLHGNLQRVDSFWKYLLRSVAALLSRWAEE